MMDSSLSRALACAAFLVLSGLSLTATAQQPGELRYIDLEFSDREFTPQPRYVKLWGEGVTLADAFANPARYEIDGISLANNAFSNANFRNSLEGKTQTVEDIINGMLGSRALLENQTLDRLAEIYSEGGLGAFTAYDFLDSTARHYKCLTDGGTPVSAETRKRFIRNWMRMHINLERKMGYFDIKSTKLFICLHGDNVVKERISRRWVVSVRSGLTADENAIHPIDGTPAYNLSAEGEPIQLISLYFDGYLIPDDGSDPRAHFYRTDESSCFAITFRQKPDPDDVLGAFLTQPTFCAGRGCNGNHPPGIDATE